MTDAEVQHRHNVWCKQQIGGLCAVHNLLADELRRVGQTTSQLTINVDRHSAELHSLTAAIAGLEQKLGELEQQLAGLAAAMRIPK